MSNLKQFLGSFFSQGMILPFILAVAFFAVLFVLYYINVVIKKDARVVEDGEKKSSSKKIAINAICIIFEFCVIAAYFVYLQKISSDM